MMLELVYEAPAECPGRAELEAQLEERVPAEWTSGADERRFVVRIVHDEDGSFSGRLEVLTAGREPSVREVHASTCRAVSTAVAVFIAIALDPSAGGEPRSAPRVPPTPQAHGSAREEAPRSPASSATPAPSGSWMWSAGVQGTYLGATAPAWGGRVHAELAHAPAGSAVGGSVRVSWGWSDFTLFPERAGEARFRLRTARAEGCGRVPIASFVVSPCAALEAGTLAGAAPDLPRAGHATARWTAAAGLLRAGWSLSSWLSLEGEVGLVIPFERMTFVLADPFRAVVRPPSVLFQAGAGLAAVARFP